VAVGESREIGVAPPDTEATAGPVDRLLMDYREYMVLERRFAARTVAGCERVARVFLEHLEGRHGGMDLDVLMAADISEFLVSESRRLNVGGMRGLVSKLRPLIVFPHVTGPDPAPAALGSAACRGHQCAAAPPVGRSRDNHGAVGEL
jgi:hypothetical protein